MLYIINGWAVLIKTEMALNVWSGTCTWLRQMDTLWCQQRVQFMTAQTIKNSNDSSTPPEYPAKVITSPCAFDVAENRS